MDTHGDFTRYGRAQIIHGYEIDKFCIADCRYNIFSCCYPALTSNYYESSNTRFWMVDSYMGKLDGIRGYRLIKRLVLVDFTP